MTHPSLGLPPRDMTAGFPAAARVRGARTAIANRAFEVALDADPTLRERYDEIGLRRLLRDTMVLLDRTADAIAANEPQIMASWAEQVAPAYRRRAVPMDDLARLCEGIGRAIAGSLTPDERPVAEQALDEAIRVLRWHRRLGGDARRRNRILQAIYKGA